MKIVYYHRVAELDNDYNKLAVYPQIFEQHIIFYKEKYNVISLDDLQNVKDKEKESLIITFDDGYEDMYENLLPIVEKHQIPVTIYVTTGCIDICKEMWHDDIIRYILTGNIYPDVFVLRHKLYGCKFVTSGLEERIKLYKSIRFIFQRITEKERENICEQLSEWSGIFKLRRENRRILSNIQIKKMSQSPYITIGAHTVTHPSLAKYSEAEQRDEIAKSKEKLEQIIGNKVVHFSYPFGSKVDYNKTTIELLKEYDFKSSVTTIPQSISSNQYTFELPRYYIGNWSIGRLMKQLNEENTDEQTGENAVKFIGDFLSDTKLFKEKTPIIIFGTGKKATSLYQLMKKYGLSSRVAAYADNDKEKQNTYISNIKIICPNEIARFRDANIVIGSTFDKEIISQLHEMKINNIHVII